MDDPKWLRLVTIGLVLAALAVGYFLLTGRLTSNTRTNTQVSKATPSASPVVSPVASFTPTPSVLGQNTQARTSPSPTATPTSAYRAIVNRTQGQNQTAQTLPNTGFPTELAIVILISLMISGWGLRRFPN